MWGEASEYFWDLSCTKCSASAGVCVMCCCGDPVIFGFSHSFYFLLWESVKWSGKIMAQTVVSPCSVLASTSSNIES